MSKKTRQKKTSGVGAKTNRVRGVHRTEVTGKNEKEFEYSFKSVESVANGYAEQGGWFPATDGEEWARPTKLRSKLEKSKTKPKKELRLLDTVLCKRYKEDGDYERYFENQRYNQQKKSIKDWAPSLRAKLRNLDSNSNIIDQSDGDFSQRPGPTED